MAEVSKGRFTAEVDGKIVVFIIGMRVNNPWKVWKWFRFPVFIAMRRCLPI